MKIKTRELTLCAVLSALALGALPSGRWRRLTGEEIALLQEK